MDERFRRIAARFEWPMLIAALLVIPVIAIEESDVAQPWDTIASVLNWAIWIAFLAEVVVMLAVVPDRGRWLRDHPLEVAIVVLTPPFLPASLQAARVFRLLRLLRLLRAAGVARFPRHPNWKTDETHIAYWTIFASCDHVVAGSRVGDWRDPSNLATACWPCNSAKATTPSRISVGSYARSTRARRGTG